MKVHEIEQNVLSDKPLQGREAPHIQTATWHCMSGLFEYKAKKWFSATADKMPAAPLNKGKKQQEWHPRIEVQMYKGAISDLFTLDSVHYELTINYQCDLLTSAFLSIWH